MKALENNWKSKSLENLEKIKLEKTDSTNLVNRTIALWKLPLNEFTVEDLRIMIGQQMGLTYLIPLALEILKGDPFAEGDFYEGDLLQNVLNINVVYWNSNKEHKIQLNNILAVNHEGVTERSINTSIFVKYYEGSL